MAKHPLFYDTRKYRELETIDFGTNILVSLEEGDSFEDIFRVHMERTEEKTQIEFWDGNSSKRITEIIIDIREKKIVKILVRYQPNPPNYQIYRFSRHLSAVHLVLDSNYGILNPPSDIHEIVRVGCVYPVSIFGCIS